MGAGRRNGDTYCAGVTGTPVSTIIATPGSFQPANGGGNDAFVVKFNPAGVRIWATYYGGYGAEYAGSTTIDPSGNVFLCGNASTSAGTTIATPCSYQANHAGGVDDAFLAKFTGNGQRIWGTYYGGNQGDFSYSCSADGFGNVYLSGFGNSTNAGFIASSTGHQPAFGGGTADAFLVKFDGCIAGSATAQIPAVNLKVCSGKSTTLTAACGNWYSTPTGTTTLTNSQTFITGAITKDTIFYVQDFACVPVTGSRSAVTVSLLPAPNMTISNSNPFACVSESITLTASGASTYSWINSSATTSTLQVYILLQTTYTVTGLGSNGCLGTAKLMVVPQLCTSLPESPLEAEPTIFPNPNNGVVTIRADRSMTLELINELGQMLKEITLSASNSFTVTIEKLPAGVYLLTDKQNTFQSRKIVVVH